jgi:hypothetical protein
MAKMCVVVLCHSRRLLRGPFAARSARPKLSRGAHPQKFALAPASPGHCPDVLDRQDVQGRSEAASRIATNTGKPRIMHPCGESGDFGSWKMFGSPVPDCWESSAFP